MIVEDRGGHGPQALEAATNDLVQAANQRSGARQRLRHLQHPHAAHLRRHRPRPRPRCWASRPPRCSTRCRPIWARSFVNDFNYWAGPTRCSPRPTRPSATRPGHRQPASPRNPPAHGAARRRSSTLHTTPTGPYRVLRYNLLPGGRGPGRRGARLSPAARRMAAMERLAAQRCRRHGFEWTELAFQQKQRRQHRRAWSSCWRVVFVFLLLAALYESVTLPLAVILIVPMCLLAAMLGVNLRGMRQQHPDPDRPRRADRPGGQERHPDRRVRPAGRGRRAMTPARGRGACGAAPGCGRS